MRYRKPVCEELLKSNDGYSHSTTIDGYTSAWLGTIKPLPCPQTSLSSTHDGHPST